MTTGQRHAVPPLAALRRHTANELDKAQACVAAIQRLLATDHAARDRLAIAFRCVADAVAPAPMQAVDPWATSYRIEYLADVQRRVALIADGASRHAHELALARRTMLQVHERLAALDRYRDNHRRRRLVEAAAREMRAADGEWLARSHCASQASDGNGRSTLEGHR